ncbi:MAG: hypothetical protein K2Z81_03585 [Cyanobacteria bacterium]|nr:hypothetical protein [Cyanobacteriota bacterium]
MAIKKKLHELVAIEKGVKQRCYAEINEIHKRNQAPDLFKGLHKEYHPLDESGGERFPTENVKVQFTASESISRAAKLEAEAIDIRASKDASNCLAKNDIEIDGKVIAKDVPVSTLLDLEKRAKDWAKFIAELPELEASENWSQDPNDVQLQRTEVKRTHRTSKITVHKVIVPATEHHPAQIKDDTTDVITGYWHFVKFSGSVSRNRKRELQDRANKFIDAVKAARERANAVEAVELKIGTEIFEYLVQ